MAKLDENRPFIPVRIAVLTVSDTRSLADDKSGQTLADRITQAGHTLAARDIDIVGAGFLQGEAHVFAAAPDPVPVVELVAHGGLLSNRHARAWPGHLVPVAARLPGQARQ